MRRLTIAAALTAAALTLGACGSDPSQPGDSSQTVAAEANDYALVMFGAPGVALQGTLGPQNDHAFDGRTGFPRLPDSLAVTADQQAQIDALRAAFQTAHQAALDSLKSIFQAARAAHEAGADRDSVRVILQQARGVVESIRASVEALHIAVLGVLTQQQLIWLVLHRPPPPPDDEGHARPNPFGEHHGIGDGEHDSRGGPGRG